MSRHTPGPWKYENWKYVNPQTGEIDRIVPVVFSTSKEIRIAAMDSDEGKDNLYTVPLNEAEANARLIAAAPDLLEACIGLVGILTPKQYDKQFPNIYKKARAAIKAAGE